MSIGRKTAFSRAQSPIIHLPSSAAGNWSPISPCRSIPLTTSNNPTGAGTVAGQGSYFYGTTNVLTATPNFGYSFSNWTPGAVILGTSPFLSVGSYSNALITANYTDANLSHTITTVTSPPGLTLVAGAGVYTNGQTATIIAPLTVTNPPNYYHFSQFTLSNTVIPSQIGLSQAMKRWRQQRGLRPGRSERISTFDGHCLSARNCKISPLKRGCSGSYVEGGSPSVCLAAALSSATARTDMGLDCSPNGILYLTQVGVESVGVRRSGLNTIFITLP